MQEISQKKETAQIILNFFHSWSKFKIHKDDLSEEEFKNWESFTEEKNKKIEKRVRRKKLLEMKAETESEEIKNICKDDRLKELYRIDFLELVDLLLRVCLKSFWYNIYVI